MKYAIALLLMSALCQLIGAEFTIAFREASVEPRPGFVEHDFRTNQKIHVGPDSGLSTEHIAKLTYHNSAGEHVLGITFTTAGADLNHAFTTRMIKQRIAIFINGQLASAPLIVARSKEECWIAGLGKDEIERYIAAFTSR